MEMAARSHAGLVRMRNEDALEIDPDCGIAVLADGMGGLMAGSEASKVVVEEVMTQLRQVADMHPQTLATAIEAAHQSVLAVSAAKEMKAQMGSTVVIWAAAQDQWVAAHVGDSRLYRWADETLEQVSRDHSLAQRMLDSGEVEPGVDVEAHYGHVLTQGMGLRQPLDPGFYQGELGQRPQRFLLCSDGLSDMVPAEKIARAMANNDLQGAADQLLGDALDMGGKDNISLILIDP